MKLPALFNPGTAQRCDLLGAAATGLLYIAISGDFAVDDAKTNRRKWREAAQSLEERFNERAGRAAVKLSSTETCGQELHSGYTIWRL